MPKIHPTAIISKSAEIGSGVVIGPFCIVNDNVKIGDGTALASHVVIESHTVIGSDNKLHSHAVIGGAPQDSSYNGEPTQLCIGDRNIIREQVTMNRGTVRGNGETRGGSDCLFMVGAHIAHDCFIGSNVTLINNATLGGHVTLGDRVVMGGLSAVHQFTRIGSGAMIGGMTGVERDVIPFGMVTGDRARLGGLNIVGLRRQGYAKPDISILRQAYQHLFLTDGVLAEKLPKIKVQFADSPLVACLVAFLSAESQRGILPASIAAQERSNGKQ